jgi:GTPase SAR1 family protein
MTSVVARIDRLRYQLGGVIADMSARAAAYELPPAPEGLSPISAKLAENSYSVLVMGEAKRGKTSFLNAVIGKSVLPTNELVATSQVFLLTNAEDFACRLRFEDDAAQPIAPEDLEKYGSQVYADIHGDGAVAAPRGQTIRWIEVDVPCKFLPHGVRLVDTPGLGSLYASHSRLTRRFMPIADGVIYVLDSDKPLLEDDIGYISGILDVTGDIFFIQTRIDAYGREHWQSVLDRNQDILRQRFKDRLKDVRIWPISNTNLMKAAETGDKDYLKVSRFYALAEALQAFLFRAGGLSRAGQALILASEHGQQANAVLHQRLASLAEESKGARAAVQQELAERRKAFEAAWGERGQERHALISRLDVILQRGRQHFIQAINPGGPVEQHFADRINRLDSVQECRDFAADMNDLIVTRVSDLWQTTCNDVRRGCVAELSGFFEAVNRLQAVDRPTLESARITAKDDWYTVGKGVRGEVLGSIGIVGLAGNIAIAIIAAPWVLPVAGVAVIAAAVLGFFRGKQDVKERETDRARADLRNHLATVLNRLRDYFLKVETFNDSTIDSFFKDVKLQVDSRIRDLAERKRVEADREYQRLSEIAVLDEEERRKKTEDARSRLREWESLGATIAGLTREFTAVDRELGGGAGREQSGSTPRGDKNASHAAI